MIRQALIITIMIGAAPTICVAQFAPSQAPITTPQPSRDNDQTSSAQNSKHEQSTERSLARAVTNDQTLARATDQSTITLVPLAASIGGKGDRGIQTTWMADTAALLGSIAWPLVSLFIILRLLKMPQVAVLLTHVTRRVTELSVAGIELKLSDGASATLEDLRKLLTTIPETHQEWVKNTHVEEEFDLVISDIRYHLCTRTGTNANPIDATDFGNFRFTLHVRDVLLTHSLRQLVDYVGDDRGGGGRMFSSRRGIIGLAWRLQKSQHKVHPYTEGELVEKWGMTRYEAKDTRGGRSVFLAFVIRSERGLPLGVFYADAKSTQLFDSRRLNGKSDQDVFDDLESAVVRSCEKRGLLASLGQLEKVRITLTQVDLYKP